MNWHHILNWKIKGGSHEFPGPEGGTCINEAAIVAAGLPYRSVSSESDFPKCFSRPIAAFAMSLNDCLRDDELRTKTLLPFVVRLAGSADHHTIENERALYIGLEIFRRLASQCFNVDRKTAAAMRAVKTHTEALTLLFAKQEKQNLFRSSLHQALLGRGVTLAHIANDFTGMGFHNEADFAAAGASILDNALKIGRQAPPIDLELIQQRMAKAKAVLVSV